MDLALLMLRLLLMAVLTVSAIAKLLDPQGSAAALRGFGTPNRLVPGGTVALPVIELAIAVLLPFSTTALLGGAAALALFVVFTAAVANQLRLGQAPPCHCFGALSREPVSGRTLVRNGILIAMALVVVLLGWDSAGPGVENLSAGSLDTAWLLGVLAGGAALVVASWLPVRRLWAIHDRLSREIDRLSNTVLADLEALAGQPAAGSRSERKRGPAPDTVIPAVQLTLLDGSVIATHRQDPERPLALLLTAETCAACHSLLPTLGQWQRDLAPVLDLVLVGLASGEGYRPTIERYGIVIAALLDSKTYNLLMRGADAVAVPSLVVIGANGRLAQPVAGGVDNIRDVISQLIHDANTTAGQPSAVVAGPDLAPSTLIPAVPEVGDAVPALTLPAADGTLVSLAEVVGRADLTLLLFWRSDCPHCQELLPAIHRWRDDLDPERIQVIAVTSTPPGEVATLAISDLTLADSGYTVHDAFGAVGSPSAILLDRQGKVASALVVGSSPLDTALTRIRGPLVRRPQSPIPPVLVPTMTPV